ncbi:MAG: lysine--tRNA ligase [Anaerolineaceae bacterium]|jgi:lysyl-tRNA synthetase class 2|nr:lysine--tRNA ligase [Anaerolineaceae bacterium]
MEFSELEQQRVDKIHQMRAAGIEPYPARIERTHTISEARALFEAMDGDEDADPVQATLTGRIRSLRAMGKISFTHIEDATGTVQLFLRINDVGEESFHQFKEFFNIGDYIQASGEMFRTRTGEISLRVSSYKMLAKSILPLPAAKNVEGEDGEVVQHATLSDPEVRYRQRYADLAVNPEVRELFRVRAGVVQALRDFLNQRDFLEVETPILQPIYGGAAARPFVTHHNQLHQDLFLRISFELYLKRLLVGGLDRVYEIGRDFRNEGVSFKHNPEFTQLEFYMAYADYFKIMELTEQMVSEVAQKTLGTMVIQFNGNEIDLTPPWKRIELRQGLIDAVGIDINEHETAESLEAAMKAKGIKVKPGSPRGKLIDAMMGDILEPSFIQPTFLYNYPRDISPLAKSKPEDPQTVERFEGFIGGMELCNAFTELNDPLDQESRFLELGRTYADGDDEKNPMDEDYLRAMSYGMPPCGGFGIGVDRLVMLLTNRRSIREVILFPHLRDRDRGSEE